MTREPRKPELLIPLVGIDDLQPWLLDAEPRSRRTHNTAVDRKEREEQSKHTQGRFIIRTSLTGFPAQSVRSSNADALESLGGGDGSVDVVSVVAVKLEGTFSLAMLSAQFYQQR
ncbi:hypothetical protein Tco_0506621 [Tanacetum coccineum]